MGGRKTFISGRVMSSGYIPPVSSKSARRSKPSELGSRQHVAREEKEPDDSHPESLCDTREVPHRLNGSFTHYKLHSRILVALRSVRI